MTKDQLITKQQLRLEELQEKVDELNECIRQALLTIFCIGGPLNDNKLGYTNEQLKTFSIIVKELENYE